MIPPGHGLPLPPLGTVDSVIFTRGNKLFELTNHLGNVLATISDKRYGVSTDDSTVTYFIPDLVSAHDYYPFGSLMPNRSYAASGAGTYRFGFNGKENDNEVKGEGDQIDYGMRVYDPRIARFFSIDPLTKQFPWYSPYQFAGNKPIIALDLDGKEEVIVVNKYSNGKQDGPQKTYTNKDAEFKSLVQNLPKDLRDVKPGVGSLEINQYQFSGLRYVFDPNYTDYIYYGDKNSLNSTNATVYTNRIAAALVKLQDEMYPDNYIKSAGVGVELSGTAKYGAKVQFDNGITSSPSTSVTGTSTVQLLSNGGYRDYINSNASVSADNTLFSVGFSAKSVAKRLGADFKLDAGAFFMFSNKDNPVPVVGSQTETVFSLTLLFFKGTYSTTPTGKYTLKLGASSNGGLEFKKSERNKAVVSSQTTQTEYHH